MDAVAAHRRTMAARAGEVGRIAAAVPAGAILVDVPLYRNIGDLLIHRGTETALGTKLAARFAYPDLGKVRGGSFILGRQSGALDKAVSDAPMLLFQGGGNLGDLWPNHQLLRETLIARHRHLPCVILPQSAHFRDPAALDRCRRVFAAHPRLTLYCRDAETLALLESEATCVLAPDMAHALWGLLPAEAERRGTLVQMRRDAESALGAPHAFDWDDCQTGVEVATWRALVTTRRLSALGPVRAAGDAVWRRLAARWIARAVARVAGAERLVTDRLHGMILAALVGTPVDYADNSYGKLGRYAARFFADDPLVRPCAPRG